MRYLPRLLGKPAVGLARGRWLKCPAHNLRNYAGLEVQMKTLGAPVPFGCPAVVSRQIPGARPGSARITNDSPSAPQQA
jgi:hypothetical protein